MTSFAETSPNPSIESIEAEIEAQNIERASLPKRLMLGSLAVANNYGNDVRSFWRAGAEDMKDASWAKRLTVGPAVGISAVALAFDLPFHETYLAKIGTHVFTETHGSTLYTGLANGGASLGIEGLIAGGVAVGVNAMPKLTDTIAERFFRQKKGYDDDKRLRGNIDKSTFLLSYGSGAFVFKRHEHRRLKGIKRELKTALGGAAFLGLVNDGIGAGSAKLLDLGESHPDFAGVATHTVDVLKSTLAWLGFVGARIAFKKIQSHRKAKRTINNPSENATLAENVIEAKANIDNVVQIKAVPNLSEEAI